MNGFEPARRIVLCLSDGYPNPRLENNYCPLTMPATPPQKRRITAFNILLLAELANLPPSAITPARKLGLPPPASALGISRLRFMASLPALNAELSDPFYRPSKPVTKTAYSALYDNSGTVLAYHQLTYGHINVPVPAKKAATKTILAKEAATKTAASKKLARKRSGRKRAAGKSAAPKKAAGKSSNGKALKQKEKGKPGKSKDHQKKTAIKKPTGKVKEKK